MNKQEKQEILSKAKVFFREHIIKKHIKNIKKLKKLKEFKINPFLINYLANSAFGNTSKESIAKSLAYPRILGTSITTTFGTQMQNHFCCEVLQGYGSITSGIDVEFIDCIDRRKKYCQIKSGPNCINKDDVDTILSHFKELKMRARTNSNKDFRQTDCVVGVLYGETNDLSQFYKKVDEEYPVIIGQEFWHRLTGDENFYNELINTFVSIADEVDSTDLINEVIEELSEQL